MLVIIEARLTIVIYKISIKRYLKKEYIADTQISSYCDKG